MALPTGEGKSLIYATLLLMFKDLLRQLSPGTDSSIHCIAVVASPLMSLMHDQVSAFSEKGLSCAFFSHKQFDTSRVAREEFQVVYLSPETLL